ncbi:MAG: hypothetical protein CL596_05265 [Alteromonas sp.]|nr:hypothetical protein [Alteromonas sp.]|tara:strand:- start:6002 stop:6307 length:306 start_codon:yes stop_codon:yes gene_type:complete
MKTSLGIIEILGIAFVILKLMGYIDWSWWLVTLPLYGPLALLFIVTILVPLIAYPFRRKKIKELEKRMAEYNERRSQSPRFKSRFQKRLEELERERNLKNK